MSDFPNLDLNPVLPPPLPKAEEAFPLLTAEEAFPPDQSWRGQDPQFTLDGDYFDKMFGEGGPGKVLTLFGQGLKQGWGHRPLGEFEAKEGRDPLAKQLRDAGLIKDFDDFKGNWVKQFNESLLRGTAAAIDAAMRAPIALYYGLGNVAVEAGVPRDWVGMIEAFPAGRGTGLPTRIRPSMRQLEEARELEIIGRSPDQIAREAFAPDPMPAERPAIAAATPDEPPVARPVIEAEPLPAQPADIHQTARMIAPDTFRVYDELAERKDVFRRWIDELQEARQESPRVKELQKTIDDTLAKVRGVEERLTKRATERVANARQEIDTFLRSDTPDMALVRRDLLATDIRMRDLAPEVSEAYREAQRLQPVEAVERVLEPVREAPVVEPVPVSQAVAQTIERAQIVELAQRRPTIARDVERQLLEVGRTAEEARASAALVQAHYEARAARFNGALGTARNLYETEAPKIVGETSAARRGSINLATNTIRLFRDSDASTFMHETAHSWLEELRGDAARPEAPAELRSDFRTVLDWVGYDMESGRPITRAQHEKFARGFERYLMEGQAPSSRLAKVFEQFKNWLTQIYQSVARLRAPITDDIRGVYDRLLSAPSHEPVIVPERAGAVDFATHAETLARETPAVDAVKAAENVLAERERVSQIISKAVDDARREARRGPERVKLPEREGAGEGTPSPGAGAAAANDALNTGRNPPAGKSEPPRTASEPFNPIDRDLVDKAGNIRVENLNVAEDVGAAIKQAAEEAGGFVEQRRGVLSDGEILKLADDLGMSPRRLDARRIGEAFNAEEIVQARKLLVQSATDVRDAMGKAATGDMQGIIDYAIARERHVMIQAQVAGITAEAGRALRAFRALKDGYSDAMMLGDFFQQNIKKTPEALQREAQMGLRLENTGQTSRFVRQQSGPTWQHMVVEGWMSSLLSGPFTHMRNIIGNTTVALNAVAETGVAAGVSKVLRHTEGREFAEMGDRLWGMGQGSVDGVRAFGKAIVDETYALEKETRVDERAFRRAIPDVNIGGVNVPVGQTIRLPLRLLAAEDEFFKAVAFKQELNVLARRSARFEGLEGAALDARIAELILDPTEEILVQATKFAEYQTFTNQLGPKGRSWQQWADTHPFARFLFPFIRTPTNIVKYAGERTPFGLASARIRDEIMGKYGEARQADAIARMALGTMTMTAVGVLAFNDLVTGGGSTRREQRANDLQAGKLPYSIRVGDTYISYRGLDPLSFPLAIAADLAEVAKAVSKDDPEYQKVAAMAVVNLIGHDMVEKLPLRTLVSGIMAVFEPEQHGARFVNQMAGTLVPGIVAQTAQISDPVQRETRTMMDALRARVGLREGLMPRRDVWGEPVDQSDVGPVQMRAASTDPVRVELARLGMGLAPAAREIQNVELTPQQYDDYVRISGRFAKMQLDDMIDKPWFENMSDGLKIQAIKNILDKARESARGLVMMESVGTEDDIVAKGIEQKRALLR